MRFSVQHRFEAPPAAVAGVLADPGFHASLVLPDLSRPEVVEHHRGDDGSALVVLRYEYVGHLDPIARRLLGRERLTWIQELRIEASATGTLHFAAEANPRLLHGDASFTLEAEAGGTVRRLEGDVVLSVPGIGGMAERRIVPGVLARLDVEADALSRRLTSTG